MTAWEPEYDVTPDKWESWDVESQEGGEMAGSDLTKLPVAEIARNENVHSGKDDKTTRF